MRLFRSVGIGVTVAALAAVSISVATPASADPIENLIGVGSDTVQDVYNAFAADQAPGLIGSYDAVNPVTGIAHEIITSGRPGCSFARPNGSGEGVNALRASINPQTTAGQITPAPGAGCIDFARSSSKPTADPTGKLQWIPFAVDAVAVATGPTSGTGATAITNADKFSLGTLTAPGDLIKLYRDCAAVTVNGVTYDPNTPPAAGATPIHLYIPQSGSGTRNFWATTLGFTNTAPPTCVQDHFLLNGTSTQVEEHNGLAVATDPNGIEPFSIAQWISQSNGNNDRRHGAVLHSLAAAPAGTAIAPIVNGNLNTAFPIKREVFTVVELARVTQGNAKFDKRLFNLLVGNNSGVCGDGFTIANNFGFGLLDGVSTPHTCGQIAADLQSIPQP